MQKFVTVAVSPGIPIPPLNVGPRRVVQLGEASCGRLVAEGAGGSGAARG